MDQISTPEERAEEAKTVKEMQDLIVATILERSANMNKMLFAMNGGGLIAMLAFIAQIHRSKPLLEMMIWPTLWFALGLVSLCLALFLELAGFASMLDTIGPESRALPKNQRDKTENETKVVRSLGGGIMLFSLIAFVVGTGLVTKVFLTL